MVNITRYSSFFLWLSRFSPEFTLDREPPSGPHTGRGGRWAGAMPGKLQGSGSRGAPESLGEAAALESTWTPSGSVVQHPCFQHWLSPRPSHGARGSAFFSWHLGHVHQETVSSGRPESGALSGTCRQKDIGVPWSSPFKIREYGRPPIAAHVLLTPYWAFGLLGRQKPRSFPETLDLSPVAVWTWHPSRSPWSGCPSACSPAHPSGGSLSGGAGAHWPSGWPGLRLWQTGFSWNTRCSQGRYISVEWGGSISDDARKRTESRTVLGLQMPISRGKPWPWVGAGAAYLQPCRSEGPEDRFLLSLPLWWLWNSGL